MRFHGTLKKGGKTIALSVFGVMQLREDGERRYEGTFVARSNILAELRLASFFRLEIDGAEFWDIRVLDHRTTSDGSHVLCEFRTQGASLDPP